MLLDIGNIYFTFTLRKNAFSKDFLWKSEPDLNSHLVKAKIVPDASLIALNYIHEL